MTYAEKNEAKRDRGIGVALLALAALTACGGSADDATKFAGVWTFESGQLAAACGQQIPSPAPFQLTGLSVTLTKVSNGAFDLVAGSAAKCTIHFSVSGNKASAASGQSCLLNVGDIGEQTLMVNGWTLELAGDRLTSTTSGIVLICSLNGSGVLVRGGPDGGAGPTDGGSDAASEVKPDGGIDATAETGSDATAETGSDATAETGSDATAETGSDATVETGSDATAETGSDATAETGSDATGG